MKKNNFTDIIYLGICSLIVSLVTVLVYIVIGRFEWKILTGALLGTVVTILNFLILSIAVNNALGKYIDEIGDKKMDDEEAEKFAKANSVKIQNEISKSYVLRTGLMIGTLVVAFISKWFDPLATMIPLLMYKPAIYVVEFIKKKRGE